MWITGGITLKLELTKKQEAERAKNKISESKVKQRLMNGWNVDDAVSLSKAFKLVSGKIKRPFVLKHRTYYITKDMQQKIDRLQLTYKIIRKRMDRGASFETAIKHGKDKSVYDHDLEAKPKEKSYADRLFEESCRKFKEG